MSVSRAQGFNAISIGAPREAWSSGPAAGAVMRYYASGNGPSTDEVIRQVGLDTEEASDYFGQSVLEVYTTAATGTFVSATGEDSSAGAVFVYRTNVSLSSNDAEAYQVLRQDSDATHWN